MTRLKVYKPITLSNFMLYFDFNEWTTKSGKTGLKPTGV